MIAFEVLFLLALTVISIVTIAAIGRPLAQAYGERLKIRFHDDGSDREIALTKRLSALEEEVQTLKQQLISTQEEFNFKVKLIESKSEKND